MTTLYKITDGNDRTKGSTQWGEGVTHRALGKDTTLCTADLIHAYEHPLLAVLHNPIHGAYNPSRMHLWVATTKSKLYRDGQLKCGVKSLTTVQRIDVPVVTGAQKVRYAIYCVQAIRDRTRLQAWDAWATNWLNRIDRGAQAAALAAQTAEAEAALRATRAAWTEARAAEAAAAALAALREARAAVAEAEAARAEWTAWTAAEAARAAAATGIRSLNLVTIAERAIADETALSAQTRTRAAVDRAAKEA